MFYCLKNDNNGSERQGPTQAAKSQTWQLFLDLLVELHRENSSKCSKFSITEAERFLMGRNQDTQQSKMGTRELSLYVERMETVH